MKYILTIVCLLTIQAQDTLSTYNVNNTHVSFESTFDVSQFFHNTVFDFINNNEAPLAKQIFELPALFVKHDKPQVFINTPLELTIPVEEFYDPNPTYINEQRSQFSALRRPSESQMKYSKLVLDESYLFKFPDVAFYYPTSLLKYFAGYKAITDIEVGVRNSNIEIGVDHFDQDSIRDIQSTLFLNGDLNIGVKLDQFTIGVAAALSEESSLAFTTSFVRQHLVITSDESIDATAFLPNIPDDPSTAHDDRRVTFSDKLLLEIGYENNEVRPQFSLQYSYQPKHEENNFYKSNVNINVLLRSPISYRTENIEVVRAIYPNFLAGGFNLDPELLIDSKRDEVRTETYKFKSLEIYLPGAFSISLAYPYKNNFWGAHLSIPLGKFGFEYETIKSEEWKVEDENGAIQTESIVEEDELFKQARSKFIFGLSYGQSIPEYSRFNWNTSLSLVVMDILAKKAGGVEDVSDIIFLPFFSASASIEIWPNLLLYSSLKLPEVTVLKTGLNYTF